MDGRENPPGCRQASAVVVSGSPVCFCQYSLACLAVNVCAFDPPPLCQRAATLMECIWLLALFILFAYTVEAVTGFGSIVIALSLGALLMPVPQLLPILVPLNILMTGWLTFR